MTKQTVITLKKANPNFLTIKQTDKRLSELQRNSWPGSVSIHPNKFSRRKPQSVKN